MIPEVASAIFNRAIDLLPLLEGFSLTTTYKKTYFGSGTPSRFGSQIALYHRDADQRRMGKLKNKRFQLNTDAGRFATEDASLVGESEAKSGVEPSTRTQELKTRRTFLPMNLKKLQWVLAILITILVPTGCNRTVKPVEEVRFGSFSVAVDYGAYLVAQQKGWFDEVLAPKGLKAHYELFQSLPPINESLASNRVDVVFEAEPPAIAGKAAGIDLKIVGVSCSVPVEIIVRTDSAVRQLKELKGKKIAVLAGTSSHYGLLETLAKVGLHPSDFQVINMSPADAKNAFETGQIDAWSVWSPWVEEEEVPGRGRALPGGDAVVYSIFAARGGFIHDHPDVLRDIVAVMQRSKLWMQAHPQEAQDIVAKQMGLPTQVISAAWPKQNWSTQIDDAMVNDIQAKADFLKQDSFIRQQVNVHDGFIDNSFVK